MGGAMSEQRGQGKSFNFYFDDGNKLVVLPHRNNGSPEITWKDDVMIDWSNGINWLPNCNVNQNSFVAING